MKRLMLFALFTSVFVSCSFNRKDMKCKDRRGVVEYGTSRIKLLVAQVDKCQAKLDRIILQKEWEVETDKHTLVEYDGSKYLNRSVIDKSLEVSAEANAIFKSYEIKNVRGIATGTYRSLTTASIIVQNYGKALGGEVQLLSNVEEASMGLKSVQIKEKPPGKFIVWDFGGSTMQFSVYNGERSYPVVGFPGSTPIMNEIIKVLGKSNSPNPIEQNKRQMIEQMLIKKFFSQLTELAEMKDANIYGIGGVHVKSIAANLETFLGQTLDKNEYSKEQVDQLCKKLVGLKDGDIGGKYASFQATNAVTVHTIMNFLGWDKVKVSEQTLTLGFLMASLEKESLMRGSIKPSGH